MLYMKKKHTLITSNSISLLLVCLERGIFTLMLLISNLMYILRYYKEICFNKGTDA